MRWAPAPPSAAAISARMPSEARVSTTTLPERSVIIRLASPTHFVYNTYTNSKGAIAMGEWNSHPWMGNALPDVTASMLKEIGPSTSEALFEQTPADHRMKKPLKLADGIRSEAQ